MGCNFVADNTGLSLFI